MSERPANWDRLTADEKRALRLDAWVRGDGIQFDSPETKARYQERATLLRDAWELKKTPARVPIAALGGGYALRRAGVPQKATMYDQWTEAAEAVIQFHIDFQPDSSMLLFLMSGASMELLGQTNMKWPGHGLPDDIPYQYLEHEFMQADEYPLFLNDPSDFILRRYLPRVHPALKGLEKLPQFSIAGMRVSRIYDSLLDPEVQQALCLLKRAAELAQTPREIATDTLKRLAAMGFPGMVTGFAAAPFDVVGDSLRGTRGAMKDLHRHPDEILAACEKVLALTPVPEVAMGDSPLVMIPLHQGSDEFMSREQYERFHWPTFRQSLLRMIADGLIPAVFAEGAYNNRLDYIAELPKGSTVWLFDRTDMHRAKDVLGNVCCIMGNVPISMIATGTAEQVRAYCKDLIDYCGKGGGYIVATGTQVDNAREETLRALVDFTREYGVYRSGTGKG